MSQTPPEEPLQVDGDKLVAFIKAVQNMGRILEEVHIGTIAGAFEQHSQINSIETVIEMEAHWQERLTQLRGALQREIGIIDQSRQSATTMLNMIKHTVQICNAPQFREGLVNLKQFSDLCDNIAKHKASGLIDLITTLTHDHH